MWYYPKKYFSEEKMKVMEKEILLKISSIILLVGIIVSIIIGIRKEFKFRLKSSFFCFNFFEVKLN